MNFLKDNSHEIVEFVTRTEYRADLNSIVDRINTLSENQAVTSLVVKNISESIKEWTETIKKVEENTKNIETNIKANSKIQSFVIKFVVSVVSVTGSIVALLLTGHLTGLLKILTELAKGN